MLKGKSKGRQHRKLAYEQRYFNPSISTVKCVRPRSALHKRTMLAHEGIEAELKRRAHKVRTGKPEKIKPDDELVLCSQCHRLKKLAGYFHGHSWPFCEDCKNKFKLN